MRSTSFLVLVVGALVGVRASGDDKMPESVETLAGVWSCVSATSNGKPLAKETIQELRLTVTKAGGYKTQRGEQVLFDSTCRVDASRKPKQIDLIGTEGENKGRAAQGIYATEGDTLTICYTMPAKDRPKEFESKVGSEATLIVWKRVKP